MSGPNDSKRYEILSSLWSMHQKRPRDATVSYVETKQLSYVFCPAAGGSKAWMAALCVRSRRLARLLPDRTRPQSRFCAVYPNG